MAENNLKILDNIKTFFGKLVKFKQAAIKQREEELSLEEREGYDEAEYAGIASEKIEFKSSKRSKASAEEKLSKMEDMLQKQIEKISEGEKDYTFEFKAEEGLSVSFEKEDSMDADKIIKKLSVAVEAEADDSFNMTLERQEDDYSGKLWSRETFVKEEYDLEDGFCNEANNYLPKKEYVYKKLVERIAYTKDALRSEEVKSFFKRDRSLIASLKDTLEMQDIEFQDYQTLLCQHYEHAYVYSLYEKYFAMYEKLLTG